MPNKLTKKLSAQLNLSVRVVQNVTRLLDNGATIAFIARYRKEATGSLDEIAVADIQKKWQQIQELEKRREFILATIEEHGKLSNELRQKIEQTDDPISLEDLYLPYRKKRKTRATKARELGLEPLAKKIFTQQNGDVETMTRPFINNYVSSTDAALNGASDIIAEWFNEGAKTRSIIRRHFKRSARIYANVTKGNKEKGSKYRDYFDYNEKLARCPSHRLLAMMRGATEGILRLSILPDETPLFDELERVFIKNNTASARLVKEALQDAYKRLLQPSIETEFRNLAKERADKEAIEVFARNLRQLLLQPPLGSKRVLALDPGFRTGCKLVCLDQAGKLLEHTSIFPLPPVNEALRSRQIIEQLILKHNIDAIGVGNGTAGKETMDFVKQHFPDMPLYMVNESGASIYSASEVAREEFPNLDLTVRGAVSIGRRLTDPLAELVKLDPKSIGVGQYQHDVNQPRLRVSLEQVVASCVNSVGVNINTASKHLLTYISGLGPTLAGNIVEYRDQHGLYKSRASLKKVPRLGSKAYEQCAGFLRIRNAANPLDNTGVHPERYALVRQIAADAGCSLKQLLENKSLRSSIQLTRYVTDGVGMPTLQDIIKELGNPGLDPRGAAKPFAFAQGVQNLEDLRPGMKLPGIITNLTKFGAFVDIGVHQDGLIHVSEMADRYISDPAEVVRLAQHVHVRVLDVDVARKRIRLSLKE